MQLEVPSKRHRVAAGGNGRELVGSEAVGPLVMTRARTPMAAALQRPATHIGALGEGRPPIGIGSTDLSLTVRGVRRRDAIARGDQFVFKLMLLLARKHLVARGEGMSFTAG